MRPGAPLDARHAVVTGAGRGIGAAIAARLLAEGARVTPACPVRESELDRVASELGASAQAICADVSDWHSTQRAIELAAQRFGPVDILVNSAGQAQSAPLHRAADELWHAMLAVNLTGTYHGIRAVASGHARSQIRPYRQCGEHGGLARLSVCGGVLRSKAWRHRTDPSVGARSRAARHHRQCRVSRVYRDGLGSGRHREHTASDGPQRRGSARPPSPRTIPKGGSFSPPRLPMRSRGCAFRAAKPSPVRVSQSPAAR